MGTVTEKHGVAAALFGQVRAAVLALLFLHGDTAYYLRQIVRLTGVGHGAVQRELAHLLALGVIVRTQHGKVISYQANRAAPIFAELHGLLMKTAGAADLLRTALCALAERIDVAFIYGSVARGAERADSDVDVLVIGDVGFAEVTAALRPVQDAFGREVNPSVFTREEARQRLRDGDVFLTTVVAEQKGFLIGNDADLAAVA